MTKSWTECNVLVTGGASFIGSHLVERLVKLGASITVIDDLSSGTIDNLEQVINKIKFVKMDLAYPDRAELLDVFADKEYVFHMAAVHGGRGFISAHPADVCSNLSVDHHVLDACRYGSMQNIVLASTACVYPTDLQAEAGSDYKLKEQDSDPRQLEKYMSADIEYGWGKMMMEMQAEAFRKQYGLRACPVRFVTTYGPRENETHAVIAMIYKAIERMNPYVIWGDGRQERDFTYVKDIVEGCILGAEKINDGTPINLGTGTKYTILDTAKIICRLVGWLPDRFEFDTDKPTGTVSRALDNSRAKEMLGWSPKYSLESGLQETIEWYSKTHAVTGQVSDSKLYERTPGD